MWGHVEFVLKAAPGTGIVSSAVMQSDTLDEIDWEFLGGDSGTVQTNYFGHADTSEYNREQTFSTPDNQADFHTYAVDWTADRIVWQIDGSTVRTLTPANADSGQYPQTPMMIKVGIWAGGDPSNPQGTIGRNSCFFLVKRQLTRKI
jgi:beta-glucanase (GH16 family)